MDRLRVCLRAQKRQEIEYCYAPSREQLYKIVVELLRVSLHKRIGSFGEQRHLALMRFRANVTLEAILVTALLLAHLTVPS